MIVHTLKLYHPMLEKLENCPPILDHSPMCPPEPHEMWVKTSGYWRTVMGGAIHAGSCLLPVCCSYVYLQYKTGSAAAQHPA